MILLKKEVLHDIQMSLEYMKNWCGKLMFINETGGEICDGKYLPVEFPNHSGLK
jgi:hypothetical protein